MTDTITVTLFGQSFELSGRVTYGPETTWSNAFLMVTRFDYEPQAWWAARFSLCGVKADSTQRYGHSNQTPQDAVASIEHQLASLRSLLGGKP